MKFVTFARGGAHAVGLCLDGKGVLDLQLAAELAGETLDAPDIERLKQTIVRDETGPATRPRAKATARSISGDGS